MAYSTGRGGAGNIQTSGTITSESNNINPKSLESSEPSPSHSSKDHDASEEHNSKEKKVYYSTGRGGAGNIASSSSLPSPKLVPQGSNTPQLHTAKVSTGRGGYGNMLKNDNPELTRKVQDVDGPANSSKENELYAVSSNKSFSVGRGGFGNVVTQQNSGGSQGQSDTPVNLATISSHPSNSSQVEKHKKKGFFHKVLEYFK
ncbi:Piso0_000921 [Millerozyma farinosa CBS 7064]|uniref:Piso0_000921 protein n=1 Tax=Pichia sorbitophila (strain ATCC MYA-4447 / BCRC 22081 / CBS 7064 / NBRC 10061 / NRRL Y-12695) TaxID=559304 RepID=G8YQF2_PICSO|nr:Piso0_000921 [Millerozyma farinosa CBS 7064]